MARMMDSLILNEFPPYTFTKITTSHRPTRTNNGLAAKLLNKSTASISPTGLSNNLRPNLQKPKVPLQGKYNNKIKCLCLIKIRGAWGFFSFGQCRVGGVESEIQKHNTQHISNRVSIHACNYLFIRPNIVESYSHTKLHVLVSLLMHYKTCYVFAR